MPHDSRNVSKTIPKEALGSLGGCLVEGDPEQRRRERRVRRRSLIISILTQAAVVALLILLPLFGRTEHLALSKTFTPIPPYGHPPHHAVGDTALRGTEMTVNQRLQIVQIFGVDRHLYVESLRKAAFRRTRSAWSHRRNDG